MENFHIKDQELQHTIFKAIEDEKNFQNQK